MSCRTPAQSDSNHHAQHVAGLPRHVEVELALLADREISFERLPQGAVQSGVAGFKDARAGLDVFHAQVAVAEAQHAATHLIDPAALLAIRAKIEANERIRRLTTELTATRNQELSVRQRAMQEIKRAQGELQRLKDQLAKERKAA